MNVLDIILLIFAGFFFIKGMMQGLIFSFFKFLAYILGIIISMNFASVLSAQLFTDQTGLFAAVFPLISYAVLFMLVVWLVHLLGKWIQKSFSLPIVGTVNRIAGGILYLIIFVFMASTFLWLLDKVQVLQPSTQRESLLFARIYPIAPWIFAHFGVILPFIKDTFTDLNHFFENLSPPSTQNP